MKTLFLGTTNIGKMKEFTQALKPLDLRIESPITCKIDFEPAETADTFVDNALDKARAWAGAVALPVLVDDSGLCIHALEGKPGVQSKRFYPGSDADRNQHILELMQDVSMNDRDAYYFCALAFVDPILGKEKITTGRLDGKIALYPHGKFGFGYDPIFEPRGYEQTVAQLGKEIKSKISHRAQALAKMMKYLHSWVHH